MNETIHKCGMMLTVLLAATLILAGCGKEVQTGPQAKNLPDKEVAKKKGDHSGWWCEEHGIPEHECSLCNDKYAAKCKKEGDWCKEHNRAKSQCFKCAPELYDKFEAKYEAKYGKKPPRPPESEFQK